MEYYIRNSGGFFIQIFLSLLLLYMPFPEASYRILKKRIMIVLCSISLVESIVFPFVISNIFSTKAIEVNVAANVYMFLSVIIIISIWIWAIKEDLIKKLIVVCFAILYSATQFMLVNIFTINVSVKGDIYPLYVFIMFVVTSVVLYPIFIYILTKVMRPYLIEIEPKNMKSEFAQILTAVGLYITEMFLFSNMQVKIKSTLWILMSLSYMLIVILLFKFMWILFSESLHRKHDYEKWRQYEIQQIQYKKVVSEMQNARRMRHDARHHIRCLSEMADKEMVDEIKVYLSELLDETHRQENERFCSNELLNGILQFYAGWARENNTKFNASVKCGEEINIPASDLTVIFGNALENAIHSCVNAEDEKSILLKVGVIGSSLVVLIENTCNMVKKSEKYLNKNGYLPNNAFLSLNEGGGYGLQSIAAMAKKYDGDASFSYDPDNHIFTTRIRINMV